MKGTRETSLAIHLLGLFRVSVQGKPVQESHWPRKQAKLLLKLLALDPKHQLHRQQLIDAIWPDLDVESGAANLHKMIHMARRALEPKLTSAVDSRFILTHGQQVELSAPSGLWIDLEQFEASANRAMPSDLVSDCEAALTLYSGDLLSEDLYADWCTRRRDQLRALHRELMMRLASLYARHGQQRLAMMQFEKLLTIETSNEEAHRELMRLYALAGRRSEALRQFQRCCEAVRSDLETEPEEETQQLYRKIVAREIGPLPYPVDADSTAASLDTIAVLPFVNDSGDPSLDYLCAGIADSLIKNLSQVPRLQVLAYSTVSHYKGRRPNPKQLGVDLGVKALVTGRLSRLDEMLVITTELVDTADGSRLWGEHYRPQRAGVLATQREISRQISKKLRLRMTLEERNLIAKRYTRSPEAYTLYLKGRFHWNKRTGEGLKKGIDYFEKAIQKDPQYGLAYSGLADCYNLLSLYSALPPNKAMPRAKAAARKALQLDESLAEAHTSLAYTYLYYDWSWSAAEREFQHALELNPNYATAHHWYHEYLAAMGRFEEQLDEIRQAEELDPLSLIINTDVGWGLYYARSYDQAIEQLQRTLDLDSNFAVAHLMLGLAYAQKARLTEAVSSIQRAMGLCGEDPLVLAYGALGYVYAVSGQKAQARQMIDRLSAIPQARYASDYCQAMILAGLDERSEAIHRLESALEQRYDRMIYLNVEPVFDCLRQNTRFQQLIRRLGLSSKSK
ncbi:MAG: hypothetical protein AUI54_04515 [Acidobacteria bacterium 13_1_40CM_2_56_5]|nr:MAG: hypothetical protein AUI54_04515 [Acidobacteria bacterium 13_1_40CM_2_56_5]